ncbi:M48 family metallopeptidase [Candidatus Synechococcus calcipolaris G9]|uniref:M48 family metallopeptidase n=1 Tax=Candidatus Synechococcus calcipolaris G9 TaxID=1497997 RepID=A0ABT6F149_9SYNE|nr:M48 family metallopeptidase [Candidatus Synechococcus calcipolaris]MDG2991550.1 M48 family metallopeptidase [Candidatus Synechococcus calcipolaris G9]
MAIGKIWWGLVPLGLGLLSSSPAIATELASRGKESLEQRQKNEPFIQAEEKSHASPWLAQAQPEFTPSGGSAADLFLESLPPTPETSPENQPPGVEQPSLASEDFGDPISETSPEMESATSEPPPKTEDEQVKDYPSGALVAVAVDGARYQLLLAGDRLYQSGDLAAATDFYRQAKGQLPTETSPSRPEAVLDVATLPPAAQVYWREFQGGSDRQLYSGQMVPLQLLVDQFPEFIPGHLQLANLLQQQGQEKQAQALLERVAGLYPDQPELQRAIIAAHDQKQEWIEASLAAQQFALLNPDHPEAGAFEQIAQERMQRFRRHMQGEIRKGMLASALTGLIGVAVTGNPFMSLDSVQTMALVLQGESAIGQSAARQISRRFNMIEDPEVLAYVDEIGQKLAAIAGRREFDYEFFVIKDSTLNAFALPGGKIFINAGAIAKSNSEAELAGLLAHEIAHAVLSHGFQLVTQGTTTANLTRLFPGGGYLTGLLVSSYSRDMERQADILGTQMLARAGYAADGLLNLMHTLEKEYRGQVRVLPWFSTHPPTPERIRYINGLIRDQNYHRFSFEGVERHRTMQALVEELLEEEKNPRQRKPAKPETATREPQEESEDQGNRPISSPEEISPDETEEQPPENISGATIPATVP